MLNCLVECYSVPWYVFTELQAHFEPASETEGVDKDTEVEGDYPLVDLLSQEVHVTPRGTRPGSVAIQEGQPHQQDPSLQLSKLRQETNRLWEHLVQKEREYQNLLRLILDQKTQELYHLQLQYKSNGESLSLCSDIGVKEGQTTKALTSALTREMGEVTIYYMNSDHNG